jgi:hypothetical protein
VYDTKPQSGTLVLLRAARLSWFPIVVHFSHSTSFVLNPAQYIIVSSTAKILNIHRPQD